MANYLTTSIVWRQLAAGIVVQAFKDLARPGPDRESALAFLADPAAADLLAALDMPPPTLADLQAAPQRLAGFGPARRSFQRSDF